MISKRGLKKRYASIARVTLKKMMYSLKFTVHFMLCLKKYGITYAHHLTKIDGNNNIEKVKCFMDNSKLMNRFTYVIKSQCYKPWD